MQLEMTNFGCEAMQIMSNMQCLDLMLPSLNQGVERKIQASQAQAKFDFNVH